MNSEENKKVGKLFEDTKYTALMAKLKTDGVPSYQGNMVTITLPTLSTAYVLPPSAAASVVPPSAMATSVQPAAASAGAPPSGAQGQAQGQGQRQGQGQPVAAGGTPVMASKVPVPASATAANLMPVSKDSPMTSVTYEWAPPVANKYLVGS